MHMKEVKSTTLGRMREGERDSERAGGSDDGVQLWFFFSYHLLLR